MIAPARITPPPPLQRTSPSRGGGEGGHQGRSIRPTQRLLSSPRRRRTERDESATSRAGAGLRSLGPGSNAPRPEAKKKSNAGGNKKRKEGRRRTKRRKFRGHRRRCVGRCRHRLEFLPPSGGVDHRSVPSGAAWKPPDAHAVRFRTIRENRGSREARRGSLPPRSRAKKGGGCNTRTSREVTHPSTTLAQARLTAEF
jgi:hypothetical protein